MNKICSGHLSLTAPLVLLWKPEGKFIPHKNNLQTHMIMAAKLLVPALWRTTDPPSVSMWYERMNHLFRMEKLSSWESHNRQGFFEYLATMVVAYGNSSSTSKGLLTRPECSEFSPPEM